MLKPLFRMHVGLLDFNVKRTRKYLGHGGAYIPECIMPWGDHFPYVYGVKYEWKDRPDKLQDGGWHKYEWVGQLEVSLMLLDYHAYTQDDAWFKQKALPAIREYVRFFDEHYKLDAKGRYNMNPAQALETWWDCTNPMPEIAGLSPLHLACITASIAGGATVCSHFNDSGFWLVKSLLGMDEKTTLKTWTVMETLVGSTGFIIALIISIFV